MAIALTAEQKQTVKGWVDEGAGLSEIQKRLAAEMGLPATYMDVRFLILDLGLQVKDRAPAVGRASDLAAASPASGPMEEGDLLEAQPPPTSGAAVSLQVDRVMKPGSLVSGTVTFSDGKSATWMLDQFGRLAISTSQRGYKPSSEDVAAFQQQLRQVLESQGF